MFAQFLCRYYQSKVVNVIFFGFVKPNYKTKKSPIKIGDMEAPPRFELGIKVLQTYALPLGYSAKKIGADYEARTRYLHLGKVALYQMS